MDVLRKGTRITCPLCGAAVGEVVRDVEPGDVLGSSNIRDYRGRWRTGDYMTCAECGFPVAVEIAAGAVIHTEDGWQPYGWPSTALIPFIYDYLKKHGAWRKEWDELLKNRC